MIIVYLSIGLAVVAVIYLCVAAFKNIKKINPSIKSMSETAASFQKQVEGVQNEVDHLAKTADTFMERMEDGKRSVMGVVDEGKSIKKELQFLLEMARTVPNPKTVNEVELSPGVKRTNERLLNLYEKWKRRRNHRQKGTS